MAPLRRSPSRIDSGKEVSSMAKKKDEKKKDMKKSGKDKRER